MNEERNRVMPATLYLVATPIGNLDDMTLRGLKVLKECDFVAAEDTRVTGKLLSFFEIKKPLVTYEEHIKKSAGERILARLKAGESCALVTDAGTPAISDPGEDLVRLCVENGIRVIAVPGACAAVTALAASGLSTVRFAFEGFLHGKDGQKRERLSSLAGDPRTLVFYEAPHRLKDTLALFSEAFGVDRRMVLCRELTKLNEEFLRLTVGEAQAYFEKNTPRGEFVLLVEGNEKGKVAFWENMTVEEQVTYYQQTLGLDKMAAIKATAKDRSVPKNEIYRQLLDE